MKEDTTKLSVQELAELYVNDPRVPVEHYRETLRALNDVFFSKRFPPSDEPSRACVFDPDAALRYCRNIQRFAAAIRIAYEQWPQLFWKIDQPGLGVLEAIVKRSLARRTEAESFDMWQVDMLDDKWDDMQANCDDFSELVDAEMLRRRMNGESLTRRIPSAELNARGTVASCLPPQPKCVFKREGNTWTVQFFDEQTEGISDVMVMSDISYLLARPNEQIPIHDLPGNRAKSDDMSQYIADTPVADLDDLRLMKTQLFDAQDELAQARALSDAELEIELEEKIEALKNQINQNFTLGGKSRLLPGALKTEIATTYKRILVRGCETFASKIKPPMPKLAKFLKQHIKIDLKCSYSHPSEYPAWKTE